ncbi:MAG: AAA family ATPase [Patescibacteria group bacterium]|jgi:ATP-dependent exoDNAse (exonuclease V) alpha subunit
MTQKEALDILKLGYNVYLTGAAGTGKTHVLSEYISYLRAKGIGVGVTASTGVAATRLSGITLNSWAGIGIREDLSLKEIKNLKRRRYLLRRFYLAKVLIIDEATMLSAATLDLVDRTCKVFKDSSLPFGGMQVVLAGDFFQLPPVVTDGRKTELIYKSKSWQDLTLKFCYLAREYLQTDPELLHILEEIREQKVSQESIKTLASRIHKPLSVATKLYTHNANVTFINDAALAILPGKTHSYRMEGKGLPHLVDALKKNCLVSEILHLKVGALVMCLKNNFQKGYVNGSLGAVVGFSSKGYPVVELLNEKRITITPSEWITEEDGQVIAKVRQIPLQLAWAITIHKSQGLSLDAAKIDLGRTFLPGMGYVALS